MNTVVLLLIALALALWYSGARAKENATRHVMRALERADLQLLDGSIYLRKIALARIHAGRFGLLRFYAFEYTANGADRYRGIVVMAAAVMTYLQIEKDGRAVIVTAADEGDRESDESRRQSGRVE